MTVSFGGNHDGRSPNVNVNVSRAPMSASAHSATIHSTAIARQ